MIQSVTNSGPIVITGATGHVGRPLVQHLLDTGVHVRAITRHPRCAALPDAATVTASVTAALPGASAVFLNSRALGNELAEVVKLARQQGVTRLVALSAANADDDFALQPSRFRGDRNKEVEQLAVESGVQWVSLRPAVFASTAADLWGPQLKVGDVVTGPFAAASFAPIADADISAVAARALLDDDLTGRRIVLTGPEVLSVVDQLAIIGDVLGRQLRYDEVPSEVVRHRLTGAGMSAQFADAYVALQAAAAETPAVVSPEVDAILGRPATSFAQWVAQHRDLFTRAR